MNILLILSVLYEFTIEIRKQIIYNSSSTLGASRPEISIFGRIHNFMNIFEELTQILAKQLRVDVEIIEGSSDIMEDLGADSLDVVEILMIVEEQFNISIPEEEFPNLRTVADLCDYIETNTEN